MGTDSSHKGIIENDEESTSLIKKVYVILRSNWLALLFALIISIITIVVVPIVYSIEKKTSNGTNTDLSWNVSGITVYNSTILFNQSSLELGLVTAIGFADDDLTFYLVDKTKNRVYQIRNNQMENFIGNQNGTSGSDVKSLNSPNDLHVNSSGEIYIADTLNHRILFWDPDTNETKVVFGAGSNGSSSNELNSPMSLTMVNSSMMYIADYGNNRIISYDLQKKESKIYLDYATYKNFEREKYVFTPITIKYDKKENKLVIAQELGFNVIRWDGISTSWTLIAGSASSELNGTSRTLFNKLCYVNVGEFGYIYVADCYNQRIQFYKTDLSKGKTIAGVISARGNNSYIFNQPTSVALDKKNNLYVTDSNNYRIQKFSII